MFRVILALDLLEGIVVHGIRGERHLYRPINEYSQICSSPHPFDVIEVLKPREVYIADLNKITGNGDNSEMIKTVSNKCLTMADTGIRSLEELTLAKQITHRPVLGTETAALKLIKSAAEYQVTVSIDIKQKKILSHDPDIPENPIEAAKIISEAGIEEIIVLNLDRVGTSSGIDFRLLMEMKNQVTGNTRIILGGGLKNEADLETLEKLGLDGAIVATAIHNGSIPVVRLRY